MSLGLTSTRRYVLVSFGAAAVFAWNAFDGLGGWRALVSLCFAIYAFANGVRILVRGDLE
jgi:hypothetical protein